MDKCIYCGMEFSFPNFACDCLDRIYCYKAGKLGHYQCGYCEECNRPKFQCKCIKNEKSFNN